MELINATRMVAGYNMGVELSGRELLVVVIKGTFVLLKNGEQVSLHDEQRPLVLADTFTGEQGFSAPLLEVDTPAASASARCCSPAHARVPEGRQVTRLRCGLRVGPMQSAFEVVGGSVWQAGGTVITASALLHCSEMPVTFGRARDGADSHPEDPSHAGVGAPAAASLQLGVGALDCGARLDVQLLGEGPGHEGAPLRLIHALGWIGGQRVDTAVATARRRHRLRDTLGQLAYGLQCREAAVCQPVLVVGSVALLDLLLLRMRFGRLHTPMQARGVGGRAQSEPVLRYHVQRDQPRLRQRRDRTCELRVQPRLVFGAEVRQRMVVHSDAAAASAVGIVALAQPADLARRTWAIDGGPEPQRYQDRRREGRRTTAAGHRLNACVRRRQVHRLLEHPHDAERVVQHEQRLEVDRAQLELTTLQRHDPRCAAHSGTAR